MSYFLSIDQGTTSTRAVLFSQTGELISQHQLAITQYYPCDGWVEHDAEEIWNLTLTCLKKVFEQSNINRSEIAALGISNQRETTVIWDRETGRPLAPAIVWQDRRTADFCERLNHDSSLNTDIHRKTGLLLDPYFSATKLACLLENVEGAADAARQGRVAFGTIDSFLIWHLTAGRVHATDATNAARTLLYNIHKCEWDEDLLKLFGVPQSCLPVVKNSADHFGVCHESLFGVSVPISGVAGDQQAALIGQACYKPGMVKSTYGTGCFMVLNTGDTVVESKRRMLSTIAYQINGKPTYALEGSIFIAGAAVTWMRDALKFFPSNHDTQTLALSVPDNAGVYLVPAFTGLGAPYWDPHARGALMGLTRDTKIEHIVRAALEAVCYQSRDLLSAMEADSGLRPSSLRVDGGMVANNWLLQFLSDILNCPINRPSCIESSALGAALLAGLGVGFYGDLDEIAKNWRSESLFEAQMDEQTRQRLYSGWQNAVSRITSASF